MKNLHRHQENSQSEVIMKSGGLIFILIILPLPAFALTPIVINDNFEKIAIGRYMEYIADNDKKISIRNITDESLTWKKSEKDGFGFGFSSIHYWFRFKIRYDLKKQKGLYLELSNPMLDYIELYIPEENGNFREIRTGDHYNFKQRDVLDTDFVFRMEEIADEITCYLHIFCPASSLSFLPTILSQKSYLQKFHQQMPVFWIYYGPDYAHTIYNYS
jgi:hypothetical protein